MSVEQFLNRQILELRDQRAALMKDAERIGKDNEFLRIERDAARAECERLKENAVDQLVATLTTPLSVFGGVSALEVLKGRQGVEGVAGTLRRMYGNAREELSDLRAQLEAVTKERDEAYQKGCDYHGRNCDAHKKLLASQADVARLRSAIEGGSEKGGVFWRENALAATSPATNFAEALREALEAAIQASRRQESQCECYAAIRALKTEVPLDAKSSQGGLSARKDPPMLLIERMAQEENDTHVEWGAYLRGIRAGIELSAKACGPAVAHLNDETMSEAAERCAHSVRALLTAPAPGAKEGE